MSIFGLQFTRNGCNTEKISVFLFIERKAKFFADKRNLISLVKITSRIKEMWRELLITVKLITVTNPKSISLLSNFLDAIDLPLKN